MIKEEKYLGDGVYAGFDGYAIVICTDSHRNLGKIGSIVSEPQVLDALSRYAQKVLFPKIEEGMK